MSYEELLNELDDCGSAKGPTEYSEAPIHIVGAGRSSKIRPFAAEEFDTFLPKLE
jgi:hypothetical protein